MAKKGLRGVFRTGRKIATAPAQKRRYRRLVDAQGAQDRAFITGHCFAQTDSRRLRVDPIGGLSHAKAADQPVAAGLVREPTTAIEPFSAASVAAAAAASNASSVEA